MLKLSSALPFGFQKKQSRYIVAMASDKALFQGNGEDGFISIPTRFSAAFIGIQKPTGRNRIGVDSRVREQTFAA